MQSFVSNSVAPTAFIIISILLGPSFYRWATVYGFLRWKIYNTPLISSHDLVVFPDTTQCEDLHYYPPADKLFTVCQANPQARFVWFPPMVNFDSYVIGSTSRAHIHVIDPILMVAKRLTLNGFDRAFVSHGMDVIEDAAAKDAVYIFVVNHPPNPAYGQEQDPKATKASSVVEVFHHHLGSSSAEHVRTIKHSLISTPNDIVATSSTSFLVTNDHFYRSGALRILEDLYYGAKWSTTVHVDFKSGEPKASILLSNLHNNNGLGRGKHSSELLINSAASGTMHIANLTEDTISPSIKITDSVQVDSAIDNPTYFRDPFGDLDGYVLGGLAHAATFLKTAHQEDALESVMVWLVRRDKDGKWNKRLLFEDDGNRVRSCSTALLVAIDPSLENGARRAWLYITGPMSSNMIAVKVDL